MRGFVVRCRLNNVCVYRNPYPGLSADDDENSRHRASWRKLSVLPGPTELELARTTLASSNQEVE